MEVYIRVESGSILALRFDDGIAVPVRTVKTTIATSGQTRFSEDHMALFAGDIEMKDEDGLEKYVQQSSGQVHAMLLEKGSVGKMSWLEHCSPSPFLMSCAVKHLVIEIKLSEYVTLSEEDISKALMLYTHQGELLVGTYECDPIERLIRFTPKGIRSNSTYTAHLNGFSKQFQIENEDLNARRTHFLWSFRTEILKPLRLKAVCENSSGSIRKSALIIFQRKSSDLIMELKSCIAAAFTINSNCICNLNICSPKTTSTPLESSTQAISLTESQRISFDICMDKETKEYECVASNVLPFSNTESVCPIVNTAAKEGITATEILDSRSVELSQIPNEMRTCSWKGKVPPTIFEMNTNDTTSATYLWDNSYFSIEDFVTHMKIHGYCFIRMPTKLLKLVKETQTAANEFFQMPLSFKQHLQHGLFPYVGYRNVPVYKKELFSLRRYCDEYTNGELTKALFDDGSLSPFLDCIDRCYTAFSSLAESLSANILSSFGATSDYIGSLYESRRNDPSFGNQLSSSNLSLFRYSAEAAGHQENAPCPQHSDISLLSIIPRCTGSSGLHAYDWETNLWNDVESGCPDDVAIVFCGEIMARLTRNRLIPCMHEVSNVVGPEARFSLAFQFCSKFDSILDSSKLTSRVHESTMMASNHDSPPCASWEFMDYISSNRVCSNFSA